MSPFHPPRGGSPISSLAPHLQGGADPKEMMVDFVDSLASPFLDSDTENSDAAFVPVAEPPASSGGPRVSYQGPPQVRAELMFPRRLGWICFCVL